MIQAKTLDNFFLWAPPPLSPTPFFGHSFFVAVFLVIFFSFFCSCTFSFFFFEVVFFYLFFPFFNIHIGTF